MKHQWALFRWGLSCAVAQHGWLIGTIKHLRDWFKPLPF